MTKKLLIPILALCLLLGGCGNSEVTGAISTASGSGSSTASGEADTSNPETDSTILTSLGEFTQEVELTNGSLFFNAYLPATGDMAYYDPDTARTEQWDMEQVTEYLGASFEPSYVPETLERCEEAYSDTFISECINGEMYWTVAFEGDVGSPTYDNFGLFYSNSFDEEYDPLRKTLCIEVSKDKLPETDTVYEYETTVESAIGDVALTIGFYEAPYYDGGTGPAGYSEYFVAECVVDGVGYRVKSKNISQEDFIKVVTSLPVFA